MANRIKRSDVAEEDLFKSIRDSAKKTIETLDKMNTSLKKTATSIKGSLKGTSFGNAKDINDVTAAIRKANKVKEDSLKVNKAIVQQQNNLANAEKNLEQIKREKLKTEREAIKNAIQLKKEKEREAKVKARLIKANKQENTAYGKLVKNTRQLKNQSKELAAQLLKLEQNGKRNSAEFLKLSQNYRQVTNAAKQGDSALKKIDSTVGDNFRNVGNYSGALNTLKSGLMQLGVAVGGFQLLRGAFSTVADFDQSVADLAAISGKSKEELKGLNDQAKELGATTQFTATQITQMQIELAKLGFTQDQIQNSTKHVSAFAAATGAEIPEAAALAGSAMRGFGLEADEMERVVSVLGVSTTKSALDFSKLQTSLSKVAPVANAMGFSIEDTTALLGQLANAGFDASMMGTATKNILLKLADANSDLAKELGGPVKNADELAGALKKLDEKGVDLTKTLELTDARSVAAFNTFLKGADDMVSLRDSITDVDKELKDMAEKRLDSINGQLTLLSSAWDGWLLSMNETSGAGAGAKEFISFLAENLPQIMNFLFKTARALILYKVSLFAVATAQKAWNLGLKGSIKALFTTTTATKGAAAATTGLGRAMKAVPWLLIIGLVAELATHFYDVATGADKAAAAAERLRVAEENARKIGDIKNKQIRETIKERKREIDLLVAKGKEDGGISEEEGIKRTIKLYKDQRLAVEKLAEDQRKLQNKTHNQIKINNAAIEKSQKSLRKTVAGRQGGYGMRSDLQRDIRQFKNANKFHLAANANAIKLKEEYRKIAKDLLDSEKDLEVTLVRQTTSRKALTKTETKSIKPKRKINTVLRTQINLYSELNKLIEKQANILRSIRELETDEAVIVKEEQYEKEFDKQVENAKKTGQYDITQLKKLNAEKTKLQLDQVDDNTKTEIIALKAKHNQTFIDLRAKLKNERDLLLAQKGINQKEINKIEAQYKAKSDEIDVLELNAAEVLQDNITLVEKKGAVERSKIKKEQKEKDIETEKELEENKTDFNDKETKKQEDKEKQNAKNRKETAKLLTDYLVRQSQERIEAIDREIAAANKQADHLRKLAETGNIEAKDSLAEQNKIIAENNLKKQQELKKQQRIKLAESVYSTYNQKVSEGSKNALADTIKDTTMLQAFINSLPTFEKGIENTGKNGRGLDGKGGFLSILHPEERVVPKEENKLIGNVTNKDLANIVNEYNTGKLISTGAKQLGNGWDSALIVKQLIQVQNAIENRPETNIELEQIIDGVLTISRSTKRGNNVNYNRYKIK